jgi:regulator of cell morphogenesis and NO signaling
MSARDKFESTAAATDLADQSLGQLAVNLPGATAVFRKLKLDFCCGGLVSLRQAALDKNLDLNDVLGQLAALQRPDVLPENIAPAALIDHIISRYHEVHRVQLPELVRMARRVEAVHRDNPDVPTGLAGLLEEMEQELLGHMHKEEAILFPLLKSGGSPFVDQPLGVMRAEHTSHGLALDQIHALTHDMQPPEGACNTWRALYAGIAQFTDDLIQHIHLENNVLFPAFEAARDSGCGSAQGGGCGCQ